MLMVMFALAANLLSQRFLSEVHCTCFLRQPFCGLQSMHTSPCSLSLSNIFVCMELCPECRWSVHLLIVLQNTHVHMVCMYVEWVPIWMHWRYTYSQWLFERFILQQFPLATHVLATVKTCLPHSSVSNTHLPRCISLHILHVRTCMAWGCNFAC